MPWSWESVREEATHHIRKLAPRNILDIGVGAGTWQRFYPSAQWTGVEIWEPYVERFNLKSRYTQIIIGDARQVDLKGPYDLAILGDVLEHVEDPLALYMRVREVASHLIIQVPLGEWPQGEEEGNPHEAHISTITEDQLRLWPGVKSFMQRDNIGLLFCEGLAPTQRKSIAVYCITKNEEQFIERWAESAKDADYRIVVDTGSTDKTLEIAQKAGCITHSIKVSPWRFDDARNASLALLPDVDLCIALDADEVLIEGWRAHLEALNPSVTRPRYKYTWSWNEDGSPGLQYSGDKIHARCGYRWKHPVHEVLTPVNGEKQQFCGMEIHHHPDPTKSRSQYLPLLEQACREDPTDDRNAHYLAREYYFDKRLEKAAEEFKRHLSLPRAKWAPERARSMRYLSKCEPQNAEQWLLRAAAEDPGRRETWTDLAMHYHHREEWANCVAACVRGLSIKERPFDYMSEAFAWGHVLYDLAALSSFYLGLKDQALMYGKQALEMSPNDNRLAANMLWYSGEKS
jgi:glycosyltransferase involved in cell wall biosynthesis